MCASVRWRRRAPQKWMRANVPGVHIPDHIHLPVWQGHDQKRRASRSACDIHQRGRKSTAFSGHSCVWLYRQEEFCRRNRFMIPVLLQGAAWRKAQFCQ